MVIKQIIYGKETIRIEFSYLPAIDAGAQNRIESAPNLWHRQNFYAYFFLKNQEFPHEKC